jgi:putative ABC transport system permease protein
MERNLGLGLLGQSLHNLGRRKSRTLLTLLGIALGVAAVVATAVVRESAVRSLAQMFDQAAGRADLTVTNAVAGIVSGGGFDQAALGRVLSVDGVQDAAPLLQVVTLPASQLDDWEFSFAFGNYGGAVLFGVDPEASRRIGHYRLASGADLPPGDESAILLTESYARELGLEAGDTLDLLAPTGRERFTLIGLLASEGLASLNRGQVAIATLASVERAFDRSGQLDQIDVVAASSTPEIDRLQERLETALGDRYRVFRPASKGALVEQMLDTVVTGMSFIGLLSLLVGGFLIYNTFATTVTERTREIGLLRALGASRGQIVGLVLAESALMGLLGAALGVLLGVGMAVALRDMAAGVVRNELSGLTLLPEHLALGLGLGVVMALISGLAPALTAARLPVVETLRRRRPGEGTVARWQLVAGIALFGIPLAGTIVSAIGLYEMPFEVTYAALVALMVGVGLLIPALIPPLERLAGGWLGLLGVEGRLGGRNLARSPGRAALTAGALMFGLVSVIVIWAVVASGIDMTQEYVDKTLSADLWIYSPQPMPYSLTAEFEALPEVELVGSGADLPARLLPPDPAEPDVAVVFSAFDLRRAPRFELLFAPDGGKQGEAVARLAEGGAVLIASPIREWYGYDLGDTIRLQTLYGPADFEVAGVVADVAAGGFTVLGTWDDARRYFGTDSPTIFALHLAPGYQPESVGRRILELWGQEHNLRFQTQDDFRQRVEREAVQLNTLYNSMVLVGVVIAGLGVANTLLMNVMERGQEIGMLRSLGMTRGQVLRLILAEAAALGGLGGVLGLGLGIWLSYVAVLTSASASGYEYPYTFPSEAVLTCAAIAVVVPLLAGLWPAWRGARADVVEAIRGE